MLTSSWYRRFYVHLVQVSEICTYLFVYENECQNSTKLSNNIFSSRKVMSFARSQKEKNQSEDGYQDYSFGESNIIDANI